MGVLGSDRAQTQRLSFLASVTVLWLAQWAVFQVMKGIFQFDEFRLHFISLFLEKIPFVRHFACRLVFMIPFPLSCGGSRIWFSLHCWHISHLLSEQFTLHDSPFVSPYPTYEYSAVSSFPYFLFNIILLVFPDLFQLLWCPTVPYPCCAIDWSPADCSDSNFSHNLPCHSLLTVSLTFSCILAVCVFLLLKKKRKLQTLDVQPLSGGYHLREDLGVCASPLLVSVGTERRDCGLQWPPLKLMGVLGWANGHGLLVSTREEVYLFFHMRGQWTFSCKELGSKIFSFSGQRFCCNYSANGAKAAKDNT